MVLMLLLAGEQGEQAWLPTTGAALPQAGTQRCCQMMTTLQSFSGLKTVTKMMQKQHQVSSRTGLLLLTSLGRPPNSSRSCRASSLLNSSSSRQTLLMHCS
jgi:hypothetical protein